MTKGQNPPLSLRLPPRHCCHPWPPQQQPPVCHHLLQLWQSAPLRTANSPGCGQRHTLRRGISPRHRPRSHSRRPPRKMMREVTFLADMEVKSEDRHDQPPQPTSALIKLTVGDVIQEVLFLADMEVEPGDQSGEPPHEAATAANQASATPTQGTSSRCNRFAATPFNRSRILYKPFNKPGVAKKRGGRPRFKVMGPDGKWKWQRSKQPWVDSIEVSVFGPEGCLILAPSQFFHV
ncbi:hypothetical protein LSTR_LSTR000259 [Laodelphax striatellus]|uniref:Uncharacterized protein n=1 Tax=Laodelphax striatellus TaxID=195883 RepID=A0A482X6K0_LAOST|nr:hypothetical protein LSTR_LSTR000259 [Laodelphax striatellus]